MLIERIFLVVQVRRCSVCGHPEDPTMPVRCAGESCACHANASGGLCSYESPVDSYGYSRVAHHLKRQGPCTILIVHNGVLLTPDSGHVKVSRPKSPKPAKDGPERAESAGPRAKPARGRVQRTQTRMFDGPDGILDRLEAKVRGA
jgi:hypothetical protein